MSFLSKPFVMIEECLRRTELIIHLKDIATYSVTDCNRFNLSKITAIQGKRKLQTLFFTPSH